MEIRVEEFKNIFCICMHWSLISAGAYCCAYFGYDVPRISFKVGERV